MLLSVVGCIEFYVKCRCGNFLLDGIKYGFYTSFLPNSNS